jgi:hypothetical protein
MAPHTYLVRQTDSLVGGGHVFQTLLIHDLHNACLQRDANGQHSKPNQCRCAQLNEASVVAYGRRNVEHTLLMRRPTPTMTTTGVTQELLRISVGSEAKLNLTDL